ncbi:MAG: type II toxin-antitoxin system HicB family antitoxin [Geminicoccaceae bacterium]
MRYAYPVRLDPEPDGSAVNVSFPDVPEALTWGDDGDEALVLAEDCVTGALRGYIKRSWPIPKPSSPRGRPTVALPPLVAAKLALYEAMRTQGVSGADLAARLGMAEPAVRRLLDLDHRSHIDQVEAALRCLGKRLEVTVRDAA